MSIKSKINSDATFEAWVKRLKEYWIENKYINVTANDKRSLDQNAAIRRLYKQMFEYRGDMTAKDVERHCKLTYGVPVLRMNSVVFSYVFKCAVDDKNLNYEQRLKVMDCFQVTSNEEFTTSMAGDMINSMMLDNPYMSLDKG